MKILALSDVENAGLWKYYKPGALDGYDLIISCGDLNSHYLSFLVTAGNIPLLYVHGNHDSDYVSHPPEGCDCIDGHFVIYNGIRIMGLGGCLKYHEGPYHSTEKEMEKRVRKMMRYLKKYDGVDIVVTHAPPRGWGDMDDLPHRGFEAFLPLLEEFQPKIFMHGHVHMQYGHNIPRILTYGRTQIVNVCDRYDIEIENRPFPEKDRNHLLYKTHMPHDMFGVSRQFGLFDRHLFN